MILTRLTADDSTDSLPQHQPTRFADPRLEYCGDTDEQLIEAALIEINERIMQGFYSLALAPSQAGLQRSFAKLVGQRDALEQQLVRCV